MTDLTTDLTPSHADNRFPYSIIMLRVQRSCRHILSANYNNNNNVRGVAHQLGPSPYPSHAPCAAGYLWTRTAFHAPSHPNTQM